MAKQDITIKLTFEYDPLENKGTSANTFLYQFLNRLDYEYPIKSIEYGGKNLIIGKDNKVKDLPLKKVDSIDKADLPVINNKNITKAPTFISKRNSLKK